MTKFYSDTEVKLIEFEDELRRRGHEDLVETDEWRAVKNAVSDIEAELDELRMEQDYGD